ncbi:Hypothetical predicted protein [Paramuricea clavata]|uniref:Uncharacterized protein n=1 Tax=Paramuricea clavata TaxID=317549 RepID=A0A6S7H6M5_PARCT|nr:Hypothetical predicted protein [Paramuricea clavata]
MCSLQQQDFLTFLDYHGTTVADQMVYNYMLMFTDFYKFKNDANLNYELVFIRWNQQNTKTQSSTVVVPYTTKTLPDETNCMKFQYTPTPKTTTMEVDTQAAQAAEQLISNYVGPNDLIEELPDLFGEAIPPPPPPPSLKQLQAPISPPLTLGQKNIQVMKEIHAANQKPPNKTSTCSEHSATSPRRQTKCGQTDTT